MNYSRFVNKSMQDTLSQRPKAVPKKINFSLTKIYYGPYFCNGILKHRPEKLRGLIAGLKELCIGIELIRVAKLNYLEINSWGYVIHQANINYLKFNSDYKNDTILRDSLRKIEEALIRILHDSNNTRNEIEPPAKDLSSEFDLSDSSSDVSKTELKVNRSLEFTLD